MNVRNSAVFLIIASAIAIFFNLINNGYYIYRLGETWILGLAGMYLLLSTLAGAVHIGLGVSYSNRNHNPSSRKLLGLFLAIISGSYILVQLYGVYKSLINDGGASFQLELLAEMIIFLVLNVFTLLLGIALASANRNFTRTTMLLAAIAAPLQILMLLFIHIRLIYEYGFPQDLPDQLLRVIAFMQFIHPVAIGLWALAVYRQMSRPEVIPASTQNKSDLLDESDAQ